MYKIIFYDSAVCSEDSPPVPQRGDTLLLKRYSLSRWIKKRGADKVSNHLKSCYSLFCSSVIRLFILPHIHSSTYPFIHSSIYSKTFNIPPNHPSNRTFFHSSYSSRPCGPRGKFAFRGSFVKHSCKSIWFFWGFLCFSYGIHLRGIDQAFILFAARIALLPACVRLYCRSSSRDVQIIRPLHRRVSRNVLNILILMIYVYSRTSVERMWKSRFLYPHVSLSPDTTKPR